MDGSRFRRPKNADEEAAWLRETTPQNTRNSTKWSLKIFEGWQGSINLMKFIQNTNRSISILYEFHTEYLFESNLYWVYSNIHVTQIAFLD